MRSELGKLKKEYRKISICVISPTHEQIRELESRHSISRVIDPRMDAEDHFAPKDNKWRGFEPQFIDENRLAKASVLEMPKTAARCLPR